MHGADTFTESPFTLRRLEVFVPADHPLHAIRQVVNEALGKMDALFSRMCEAPSKGDRLQQLRQLGALVDGYDEFGAFDRRELVLIEPLRTLRLVHYSAWLAQRWHDPIFPINFPWFGSSDYWKGQVDMLIEQLEAMQAPPLVA